MTVPNSVKSSKPLIIGGGPTGSVAAAHLHKLGIPATLIEKEGDFTDFDVTRAYCLRLDYRAGRVLKQVEGLFEFVSQYVESTTGLATSRIGADGKNVKQDFGRAFQGVPDLADLRPCVVDTLKQYVTCLEDVDARYGVTVTDIQIADDGEMTVVLQSPDGQTKHNTRLLLACDGRNSQVAKLLDQASAHGSPLNAPYGLGVESFNSPAVGLALKSIVMNETVINELLGEREPGSFVIRQLVGDLKRGFDDLFRMSIFPAGKEYTRRVGGFVGTIVRQPDHNIWKLSDIDSAYDFFQANFPQMNVRNAISEKEMRRFVEAKPSRLGDIRRRKSLTVKTGNGENGGAVVFLGDSAHAFPPDIGQGVCAAMGDVGTFAQVLGSADESDGLVDVMMRYGDGRSDEGKALMKLSQFGSPYQYGVYPVGGKLWAMNYLLRKVLSQLLPGFLWPQLMGMLHEDITYGEIVRRGNLTTARLVSGTAAMVVAIFAVVVKLGLGA